MDGVARLRAHSGHVEDVSPHAAGPSAGARPIPATGPAAPGAGRLRPAGAAAVSGPQAGAAPPHGRIELAPPDLAPYHAGNTGVAYYTTLDSGRPGPHVLLNALIHGNELCGALALDHLFRTGVRPARGRLTLGFANVAAYARFDPARPGLSRYVDEDLNRVWSPDRLDGPARSAELERARALRPLVDDADLLLDLHSMQFATAPLMLAGPLAKGRALAEALGYPEHVVSDAGHPDGTRLRDYGAFADPAAPQGALLLECGQHWRADSVEVAIEGCLRMLALAGMIERPRPPLPQRIIQVTEAVTIRTHRFRFARAFIGMEVIPQAGTTIAMDGPRPVVTPCDDCVLIMPSRRLEPGLTAVRLGRFVR
jgi:predicted deacylase